MYPINAWANRVISIINPNAPNQLATFSYFPHFINSNKKPNWLHTDFSEPIGLLLNSKVFVHILCYTKIKLKASTMNTIKNTLLLPILLLASCTGQSLKAPTSNTAGDNATFNTTQTIHQSMMSPENLIIFTFMAGVLLYAVIDMGSVKYKLLNYAKFALIGFLPVMILYMWLF